MKIETNRAKIKATIRSINSSRQRLVDNIQSCALSVANHAHLHGDITLLEDLHKAVGNGMKSTALKLWLLDYAPVIWDSEAKAFAYSKSKKATGEELEATLAEAAAKPWYDYKTEKQVEEFTDVYAGIAALLRKLEKKPAKDGQEEAVKALKSLAAKLEV